MVFPQSFPLSAFEAVIFIAAVSVSAIIVFLGWIWYYDLDRRTHAYDEELCGAIQHDRAFSGIREVAQYEFIATSDSSLSKFIGRAKEFIGRGSEDPHKIIPVDEDVILPRKIEFIRERVQLIPGRNILGNELMGAIRNHYAYQLALSVESTDSPVIEHFESQLGEYEYSQKIADLSKSGLYDEITLLEQDTTNPDKDPLNDVYLPLVSRAEKHCVRPAPDLDSTGDQIDRCREVLQLSLFMLWARKMKGIEVTPNMDEEICITEYRTDIRDEDNWGYWMLSSGSCEQPEFERLRHLAWRIQDIIDEHWVDGAYSKLYPHGGSIREMEYAESPFVVFHKEEQEIRGGGPTGSS